MRDTGARTREKREENTTISPGRKKREKKIEGGEKGAWKRHHAEENDKTPCGRRGEDHRAEVDKKEEERNGVTLNEGTEESIFGYEQKRGKRGGGQPHQGERGGKENVPLMSSIGLSH